MQTFDIGSDLVKLRVYNKVDEINEKSKKTWFFKLWSMDHDVWRIEWQIRKDQLRKLGISSFESLDDRQGDLLRLPTKEHTTIRIKANDTNRSCWPIHPLWDDLIQQVNQMKGLGVVRDLNKLDLLDKRLTYIAISVYGYLKRVAAIDALYTSSDKSYMDEAFTHLQKRITELHDPLSWQQDVDRRAKEMSLGEWKLAYKL